MKNKKIETALAKHNTRHRGGGFRIWDPLGHLPKGEKTHTGDRDTCTSRKILRRSVPQSLSSDICNQKNEQKANLAVPCHTNVWRLKQHIKTHSKAVLRDRKPRPTPHCKALSPGEFNSTITEHSSFILKLLFTTTALTIFP